MIIHTAEFVISNSDYRKCPSDGKPEFAFIGRSNVGKSSLINMLVGKKQLAKTSSTPGKTQLINHFLINDEWFLVDLPGYGYAKASQKNRAKWENNVRNFLSMSEHLTLTFVLIDSRIPPQKSDISFINFLGTQGIPLALVFTKTDKQGDRTTSKNIALFERTLKESWEELPKKFLTSAVSKQGKDGVLTYIEEVLQLLNSSNEASQ